MPDGPLPSDRVFTVGDVKRMTDRLAVRWRKRIAEKIRKRWTVHQLVTAHSLADWIESGCPDGE